MPTLSSELGQNFRADVITGLDTLPLLIASLGEEIGNARHGSRGSVLILVHVGDLALSDDEAADISRMRIAATLRQLTEVDDLASRMAVSTFAVLVRDSHHGGLDLEGRLLEQIRVITGPDVAVRSTVVGIDERITRGALDLLRDAASQLDAP